MPGASVKTKARSAPAQVVEREIRNSLRSDSRISIPLNYLCRPCGPLCLQKFCRRRPALKRQLESVNRFRRLPRRGAPRNDGISRLVYTNQRYCHTNQLLSLRAKRSNLYFFDLIPVQVLLRRTLTLLHLLLLKSSYLVTLIFLVDTGCFAFHGCF